jgi:hypothetical protein
MPCRKVLALTAPMVLFLCLGCAATGRSTPRLALIPPSVEGSIQQEWQPIEVVAVTWPTTRSEIVVEQSQHRDSPRLRIRQTGVVDFVLMVEGGLDPLSEGLDNRRFGSRNEVSGATYLLFPPGLRSATGRIVMMVARRGAIASDPGSLRVVVLASGEAPEVVFDAEPFVLTALTDLDRDGFPEVVGKPSFSEAWGPIGKVGRPCFSTYDPFVIYRLPVSLRGKAEESPALSELYNREHYVWAGPSSSEDWTVVSCGSGNPRVMSREEALRRYGK